MEGNAIITTHNLDFLSAEDEFLGTLNFKIGTCVGQWGSTWDSYYILTVINDQPGNGHFDDVLQWFEYSAKRDNKNLIVLELWNERLYFHLLIKRGFIPLDTRIFVLQLQPSAMQCQFTSL